MWEALRKALWFLNREDTKTPIDYEAAQKVWREQEALRDRLKRLEWYVDNKYPDRKPE